jgi:hypothetical protein
MSKLIFIAAFINFVALSTSQECNPNVVEWFPHQYSCQKYVLCYHGNPLGERSHKIGTFLLTFLLCREIVCARIGLQRNGAEVHAAS